MGLCACSRQHNRRKRRDAPRARWSRPQEPAPDLVRAALERAGGREGTMVGDTPWDVKAAQGARIETLAVLTGGFSAAELRDAGAPEVFDSVAELRAKLDRTRLA